MASPHHIRSAQRVLRRQRNDAEGYSGAAAEHRQREMEMLVQGEAAKKATYGRLLEAFAGKSKEGGKSTIKEGNRFLVESTVFEIGTLRACPSIAAVVLERPCWANHQRCFLISILACAPTCRTLHMLFPQRSLLFAQGRMPKTATARVSSRL